MEEFTPISAGRSGSSGPFGASCRGDRPRGHREFRGDGVRRHRPGSGAVFEAPQRDSRRGGMVRFHAQPPGLHSSHLPEAVRGGDSEPRTNPRGGRRTAWTPCSCAARISAHRRRSFCSETTFRSLYFPYYKQMNDWIHAHTQWRTFKHSCGSVIRFIPAMIEAGFDILNPVQCSATGMDAEKLKVSSARTSSSGAAAWTLNRCFRSGSPRKSGSKCCDVVRPSLRAEDSFSIRSTMSRLKRP